MVVGSQQLDDTECKVQVEGYQIGEERDGGKCGLLESPAPNMCLKCGINANDLLVLRRRVLKRCSRLNAMIRSSLPIQLYLHLNVIGLSRPFGRDENTPMTKPDQLVLLALLTLS